MASPIGKKTFQPSKNYCVLRMRKTNYMIQCEELAFISVLKRHENYDDYSGIKVFFTPQSCGL